MTDVFSGLLGFGLFAQLLSCLPFVLLILPFTYLFNVRLYTLYRKEDCLKLQDSLTFWTNTLQDGKGCGYSLNWDCYVFLSVNAKGDFGNGYNAWMLCNESTFTRLMRENHSEIQPMSDVSNIYSVLHKSSGNYNSTYYLKDVGELEFVPRKNQAVVIDKITELYREKGRVVAFISGAPNSGKSMVGVFLAHSLGGVYCNEFTPWSPGDSLTLLKQEHKPCKTSPLVISMDEVDDALIKISKGLIKVNETTMISTATKNGWNTLFDNIERGMYPYTIILLTSNRNIQEISAQCGGDSSFLREKRVTECFKL